jgi:PAS domain S-box-containing protein
MTRPFQRAQRLFSKLQFRLLFLLVLLLLPALLLSIYTASEQGQLATRSAQQEALRLAQISAANQEQRVSRARELLIALAQLPTLQAGDTAACNKLLSELVPQYASYTNLFMVDAQGNTICSGLETPPGFNVAGVTWFKRAMVNEGFNASDYDIGALTRRPVITFSYPIYDVDGDIRYQVGASLDLQRVGRFITPSQLPADTTITVIDRKGVILYRFPDDNSQATGTPWADIVLLQKVLTEQTGTSEARDIDGVERLYGFTQLDGTNGSAYVLVGTARNIAFAEANRLLTQNLIGLAIVGLSSIILIAYGVSGFLVRPVQALVQGTLRLAEGNLKTRIDLRQVENTSELVELGRAFNQMAASVEELRDNLEAKVQERTQRLEFLSQISMTLWSSTLSYENVLKSLAQLAVPTTADWCSIDLIREDGTLRQLALVQRDSERQDMVSRIRIDKLKRPDLLNPAISVVNTGKPLLISHIDDDRLKQAAPDESTLQIIREFRLRSMLFVPLVTRGQLIGVLGFSTSEESGRTYQQDDVSFAEEIARRAAMVVENARLYSETEQSRKWLEITLSSIGDAVIATDTSQQITFMNPVARTLTGWDDDPIGRHINEVFRIVNEHTREPASNPVTRVLHEGGIIGLANHTLLIAKDGTERPIADSGAPILDSSGNTIGAVLVFRDVTAERATQNQIQASEARYRDLFENANDIIYTLDLDGNLTSINKIGERVTGYSRDDLLGKSIENVILPDYHRPMLDMLQRKMDGETRTTYPLEVLAKDGHRVTLEVSSRLIHENNRPVGIQGIARDITERARTERALQFLADASGALSTSLDYEITMRNLAELTVPVMADWCSVFIDQDNGEVQEFATLETRLAVERRFADESLDALLAEVRSGNSKIVNTPEGSTGDELPSAMIVPLIMRGRAVGALLFMRRLVYDAAFDLPLAQELARRAANAIENARLHRQAQEIAVIEERQRLARDLHDAVTQTLFTASIMAESLTRQTKRNPEKMLQNLSTLHELARGALAEMRTLLLELRPANLVNTSMSDLLRQLTEAARARKKITFDLHLNERQSLPPSAHIAVYRIAQESLNNIVKHAQADAVTVEFNNDAEAMTLRIMDNGLGFTSNAQSAGMGLRMMQERAEEIGAALEVSSVPKGGTQITVTLQHNGTKQARNQEDKSAGNRVL